ncbi:MAG: DNA oxidative demethylase AlkB [Pedobacter sp.]|nr:DNA oxidative demethylase AlkB [Pedobacter sp.]
MPPSNLDLFSNASSGTEALGPGAMLLRGFARAEAEVLLQAVSSITAQAPFRHLVTPGGHVMSVAMTNCGALGWVSDEQGYRYSHHDPDSGQHWPAMPAIFLELAARAADVAGYANFKPDACLINRYLPDTRLTLHQDRNEHDADAPIVSVSLGVPATFLWGGLQRNNPTKRHRLEHGDVAVWGGPSRFFFHGIAPLQEAWHPLTQKQRINLTFRKAR